MALRLTHLRAGLKVLDEYPSLALVLFAQLWMDRLLAVVLLPSAVLSPAPRFGVDKVLEPHGGCSGRPRLCIAVVCLARQSGRQRGTQISVSGAI